MGKTRKLANDKGKTKQYSFKLIIILTIITFVLSYLTTSNYVHLQDTKNKNIKLMKNLQQIEEKYSNLNKENTELSKKLEELNNIDNSINETKKDIFKLAQELEQKIINKETDYKIAYLTFDDGPYYSTNKVLEILNKYNVKATFFTIGLDKDTCYDNKSYSCKELYKKIVDAGHTIANHTYSHQIFKGLYSSPENFISQIKNQEQLIQARTGVKTNIMRFPGGSNTCRALAKDGANSIMNKLKENGYGWVDWTAQDGDGGYLPNYDTAWKNFTESINEDIEVILFHDYSEITISMLPNAIEYLQNKNYILLPLFYKSIKVNK